MKKAAVVVVVVVAAAVSGCGDVRITGLLGERLLRSTGTVAAWLDSTVYEDKGDGSLSRVDRITDATELHLEFFEPVFDPTVDFGALPPGERAALADNIARGDQLSIRIRRGEALRPGDDIESLPEQGLPPQVLPFISLTTIALRERPVDDASYPEEVLRPGSAVSTEFAVGETTPTLSGTLTIDVDADVGEDAALEGKVVVEFSAELLPERIAECNFDRLQGPIDACTLAPSTDREGE
ncbi:MAG: hypothetical protein Q8O67_27330 [Deltaproteobacteria bacterium]|nr:hypothetical protein [Deltaproteobacteria bacterium]